VSARITPQTPALQALRMRLHAQHQPVVLMRTDCHVCRAEGLAPRSQVLIIAGDRTVQALLYQIDSDLLKTGQIALSEAAWDALDIHEGDLVQVRHPPLLESLSAVRARIHGHRLQTTELQAIVRDVVDGRYTDVALSAFLTATAVLPLDMQETIHLTRAMVDVGDHLQWQAPIVVDKHCVGGLPGNRTTMVIVPIVAACGLRMPKTSSRAITSPAGTADTMETLAPVDLDVAQIRRVVERTGGCIVWGGAVRLSPADDILIRVERPLDLDSQGQLVASVLSKKAAAGSTHVVIDMPVGLTAKVRSAQAATLLGRQLEQVGQALGMQVCVVQTDGLAPVGRGIGPALEARDVLSVLRLETQAPADLAQRSLQLAGRILEFGGAAAPGSGLALATSVLADGRAWRKFQAICEAQGGLREPPVAAYQQAVPALHSGSVIAIDNRRLARIAKLAGAPKAVCAGIDLHVRLGEVVERGQPLFTLHAATPGELAYALEYATSQAEAVHVMEDAT